MLEALNAARERKTSIVTQLVDERRRQRARHRRRRLERIRRAAVRSGRGQPRPRNRPPRQRQAARQAPRAAALPARQAAVPRRSPIRPTCMRSTRSSSRPASASRPSSSRTTSCRRPSTRRIEQVDSQMSALTEEDGVDLESLEVTGGEDELDDKVGARRCRRRADRALRQQGHARCHPPRRLGHPLRAVREDLSRALPHGRRAEGDRAAARCSWPASCRPV